MGWRSMTRSARGATKKCVPPPTTLCSRSHSRPAISMSKFMKEFALYKTLHLLRTRWSASPSASPSCRGDKVDDWASLRGDELAMKVNGDPANGVLPTCLDTLQTNEAHPYETNRRCEQERVDDLMPAARVVCRFADILYIYINAIIAMSCCTT
jgi:hypothetical protein